MRVRRAAPGQARVLFALGLALVGIVVFAASTIVGFQNATSSRVKPGVAVLDVPVGGLTLEEARARLAPRTSAILDQPLELSLGDRKWTTSPRDLGVRVEANELANRAYAVGRDSTPAETLALLRGGAVISVMEEADGSQLDALVSRIAAETYQPVRDAQLGLRPDGKIDFTTSEPGVELDQQASRAEIAQALTTGTPRAALVTRPIEPAVRTEHVADAHAQLQRILAPESIELTAAEQKRSLGRGDLLKIVLLKPATPSTPAAVSVDAEVIQTFVSEMAAELDRRPVDARYAWNGGQLSLLREGRDGRKLDVQPSVELVKEQILSGGRAVQLPVSTVRPAVPSDATSLGIRELIDESTTTFAGSVPEKAHNIRLAAQRLNGVVVPPGGTFSFNAEVGPTTLESGFQWGFGLTTGTAGARTVPSVAGGICQVATTLFQSVFWAGYQLEERWEHLYWIPNYTSRGVVGLDATVDGDSGLDFKWINPTSDYVLIQSSTGADSVTFRLYGKKPAWTVKIDSPVVTNRVAPNTAPDVQPEPLLAWGRIVPVETAREGFQVVITRHVTPDGGADPRNLPLKSTYKPGRNVTLVGTAQAPDSASVTAAVNRVRGTQQPPPAAPQPGPSQAAPAAPAAAAPAAPAAITTPNGAKTLAQIRDELRRAGWGGGSDEDAVATYNRLASTARGN